MRECGCATEGVWKSEDNFVESVFFYFYLGYRDWTVVRLAFIGCQVPLPAELSCQPWNSFY